MPPLDHLQIISIIASLLPSAFALPIFPNHTMECSPTTWTDIFSFFLLNYVAHAATAPSPPGVNLWGSFLYPYLSVLFPFVGVGRTASIFLNNAYYGKDDLGKALSVGALAVVARTKDWKPPTECSERLICEPLPSRFLENPESAPIISSPHSTIFEEESSTAMIIVTENDELDEWEDIENDYSIHGRHALPDGYRWIIPLPALCFTLVEDLRGRGENKISRSRSLMKMVVSVVQLVASSVTIYRTRGPQIARYGYTSFGLSTIPYAFMSFVNLVCIGCTGEYPYLFMLQTQTLKEASGRAGAEIAGAVGILAHDASQHESGQGGDGAREGGSLLEDDTKDGVTFASLWREDGGTFLYAKIGHSTRRFKLVDNIEDATLVFDVHCVKNRLRIYEPEENELKEKKLKKKESWPGAEEKWPGLEGLCRRLKDDPNWVSFVFKIFTAVASPVLALFLPYVIIYILTKFEKQQSTTFQRVVMMSWLAGGQLPIVFTPIFILFPNFVIPSPRTVWRAIQKWKQNPDPDPPEFRFSGLSDMLGLTGQTWWMASGIVIGAVIVVLISIAIGLAVCSIVYVSRFVGFVMVGKMLREFDTCSLI